MTQWRTIPGHEPYEVSDDGRLRGPDGYVKQNVDYYGYPRATAAGEEKHVHLWVLLAFVGPRPEGMVTRHLDGDPTNNHLTNLRYGTYSENVKDAVRHGTYRNQYSDQTECKRGHSMDDAYVYPDGRRECRTCKRDNDRAYRLRKARRSGAKAGASRLGD